jgi:hypothetical protein
MGKCGFGEWPENAEKPVNPRVFITSATLAQTAKKRRKVQPAGVSDTHIFSCATITMRCFMANSRFWKVAAALLVAGVFYVGHGLHQQQDYSMPSVVREAHAEGVAMQTVSPALVTVTCSPDGKNVYYFGAKGAAAVFQPIQFLGTSSAP